MSSTMEEILTATGDQASPNSLPPEPLAASPSEPNRPKRKGKQSRMRREKYTARACLDCQQRKVKCSGEDTCRQCRNRNITCIYTSSSEPNRPKGQGKRKRQTSESVTAEATEGSLVEVPTAGQPNISSTQEQIRRLEEGIQAVAQYGGFRIPCGVDIRRSSFPVGLASSPPASEQMSEDSKRASSQLDMVHACDGETDTFEAILLQSQSLSLSSQLTSLRKLLGLDCISMEPHEKYEPKNPGFLWELPAPGHFRQLLDVYFCDFDSYLPYLDQTDTERRVFDLLSKLDYNDTNQNLALSAGQYPLAALICNILAMAECLDPNTNSTEEPRPGWSMYLQGCRLIQHCSSLGVIDLDIVRYYAVGSGYLMHSECLRAATRAISLAIQLAAKAKLNNQDSWTGCSEEEVLCRKKLWWTIYFMDRRIGQKNGTAYLIRDSEVCVDDFAADVTNRPHAQSNTQRRPGSKSARSLSVLSSDSRDYLQVLVDLGRLWGQIWDRFFAVTAPNLGDWQEIEIVDRRIVALQRQLPQHLTWNQDSLYEYANGGETEAQIRRRLTTLTRINTLRLIIRQNPLIDRKDDLDTKRFCADLAAKTIEAIGAFRKSYPCARPSGYFMTASLVECICQLVPLLQSRLPPMEKTTAAVSFRTAYRILVDLSSTMASAKHAIKALKSVFSVGEVISLFKTLETETERVQPIGDELSPSEHHHSLQDLGQLPLTMTGLQWPPNFDFLSAPSAETPQTKTAEFSGQTPVADIFGHTDFGRNTGALNHNDDLDLTGDPFMYGEYTSQVFT